MAAASRSLGVVNSVVSKNLKELEGWLGTKLLFRSTRHLRLTPDGQAYLPECREILRRCEQLEASALEQASLVKGKVRVTAPLYLGQNILVPVLADFLRGHTDVDLEIILDDKFQNITEQGFDIAFRVSQLPDSSYLARKLSTVKVKLVASPGYINARGLPRSLAELRNHSCIVEAAPGQRQRWKLQGSSGRTVTVTPAGHYQANNGNAVKAFCCNGLGIAQLPDFFVDQDIADGELVEILPETSLENYYLHLLYHRRPAKNDAIRAVIDHVCAHFQGQANQDTGMIVS